MSFSCPPLLPTFNAEPAIPWYLTYRSQWPLKAVPANDLEIWRELFWHPAFCQKILRQRHFGMCFFWLCEYFNTWTFGSVDVSVREYFSIADVLAQII